jgi:non-ribosomal peptide synthetase component F
VSKGIQKEERVALYAHRSSALVVGIMGILKSGATFTVIDPAYPIERQVRLVLTGYKASLGVAVSCSILLCIMT